MHFLKVIFLFHVIFVTAYARTCLKAPEYVDQYIGGTCRCAIGIKILCSYSGVTLGSRENWIRGTNVKALCDAGKPPARYTPIATFLGPNNNFLTPNNSRQHAALFESCEETGIKVWDQYCYKVWGTRIIAYSGEYIDGAANYYTF